MMEEFINLIITEYAKQGFRVVRIGFAFHEFSRFIEEMRKQFKEFKVGQSLDTENDVPFFLYKGVKILPTMYLDKAFIEYEKKRHRAIT